MAETMIPMPGMEVEISVQGMQASRFEAIEAAEAARSTAETERESAESARAGAEQARVNAESVRNAAESGRKAAEEAREQNEAARAEAEGGRVTAESARVEAENLRALAETGRAASEAARAAAESARASAEQVRADAEAERAAAEAARASAETARAEAESGRVAAEELRAETFAGYEGRLSAMDEAIASKADKTALALANRRLDALWKLSQGISYQFETDSDTAYQKTVPSGAKLASVGSIGGYTEAVDGAMVSTEVESVKYDGAVIADIPAAVRALPGYGRGAGSAYNGIERTDTGWQYVRRVASVDLSTVPIRYYDTASYIGFCCIIEGTGREKPKNNFNWIASETYVRNSMGNYSITATTDKSAGVIFLTSLIIRDDRFGGDVDAFKAAMSGVTLYYEINEPEITDISGLMGDELDAITVEAGCTLTFENAETLPVPSSIEYAVSLAEVT